MEAIALGELDSENDEDLSNDDQEIDGLSENDDDNEFKIQRTSKKVETKKLKRNSEEKDYSSEENDDASEEDEDSEQVLPVIKKIRVENVSSSSNSKELPKKSSETQIIAKKNSKINLKGK